MEKSSHSSFLKSLALAFGDGLLFGVAMKLAQGPSKTREDEMTDLGPLAERLRKVEDHTQTIIDKDGLVKYSEGLDGRVLEKVIVALEARLTEHVGQVDRRLAEMDAQVALDLKAVDTHTTAQTSAVEKAIQQIEAQVRDYVAAAQQVSSEQISEVDQKFSALQETLPAKFREIIEAVRQSMEARVALELTEMENRVSSRGVAAEQLQELQTSLRGEVEAL
jgi:DNA anti-recombination protein RmuC